MRAFIAIELTEEIKDKLKNIQNELKGSGADVKWVEPENIHLTLKFLGDIDEKKIEDIKRILEKISEKHSRFSIELSGIGAFPKISDPRVIWIGVEKGKEELSKIFLELEEQLCRLGFKREERGFSAHITIGRLRSPLNRPRLIEEIKKIDSFSPLSLSVNRISLFKSTLTPKGPIYEIIYQVNLK
jgi:2'-5' RNA ligase